MTGDWEDFYPFYFQEKPKVVSDHWSALLYTTVKSFGPKPFRFENMWATHPSFRPLVDCKWKECIVGGWGGFCFMKKLGYLKRKLLDWNKITFSCVHENKHKLWAELQDIDCILKEAGRRSEDLVVRRRDTLVEMDRILKAEQFFGTRRKVQMASRRGQKYQFLP